MVTAEQIVRSPSADDLLTLEAALRMIQRNFTGWAALCRATVCGTCWSTVEELDH
jgi:succinate dehydrogenase/fumarate reductase-like Fe-S protein